MKIKTNLLMAAGLVLATASSFGQTTLPDDVVRVGDREFRFGQPNNAPVWDPPLHEDYYPTISADGLTLLFDSTRPGGLGGFDFWMCTRPTSASAWSEPVNLGAPINSAGDENSARFSRDGLSLYFVSTRPGGAGGYDIWVATRSTLTQPFAAPVNLGSAINSSSDDGAATVSGDNLTMVFFSDRMSTSNDFFISSRASATAPWEPARLLEAPISSSSLDVTPLLSPDGLLLFFGSSRPPATRVYGWVARRPDAHSPFGEPVLINQLVDPTNQRGREPVAFSADGAMLYYVHFREPVPDRGGGILSQISITALPQLRSLPATGNGQIQFELLGREGANYTVETSTDLRTWTPWITTNTTDRVRLTDTVPPNQASRYYRAVNP